VNFETLEGQVLSEISGGEQHSEEIIFTTVNGGKYKMYHQQDCCESVDVEEIIGDLDDLIGTPILLAEEVSETGGYEDFGSSTWTFYKLSTIKGHVTIRWLGVSNGYYSESVSFVELEPPSIPDWEV
jgi:hypothetical protein